MVKEAFNAKEVGKIGDSRIARGVQLRTRIAPEAPPPPRVKVRMSRPSRNHVWIQGYWDRQDDRWAWAPGRWEEPSQRGSRWIRPQYRQEEGTYRYEPGRGHNHGRGHDNGHDRGDERRDH